MKPMVALCSDDAELYLLLRHILEAEGYICTLVGALIEIKGCSGEDGPHAIIVDCSADDFDAVELCTQLKSQESTRSIPIAALISPDKAHQFVQLIKSGVEDGFIIRPLIPDKLLHFLRNAKRGVHDVHPDARTRKVLRQGDLEINFETHCATFNGRRIELAPIGFRLLCHLLQYPNCVHSRQDLIAVIWGVSGVDPRMVDVHVRRLRKSLQAERHQCPIKTVRSCGYMLETPTVS